jgi:hypothetical protein
MEVNTMSRAIRSMLTFISLTTVMACSSLSAQDIAPRVDIKEALRIATTHTKKNKVITANMHISSAIYDAADPSPHWRITWKTNTSVKGGWIEVLVHSDKSVETRFGE